MVNVKKWHILFDLPVQKMDGKDVFSRMDLLWSEVCCPGGTKKELVAAIPINRLDDFLRGEENNVEAQCKFVRKHFVNRSYDANDLPPNGAAMRTVAKYWCSYRPQDKMNAPDPPKRKRNVTKKRGCKCHFFVKVYEHNPTIAYIEYSHFTHVDSNNIACHGVYDPEGDGRYLFAPRLSPEVIMRVEELLAKGVSVETITNGTYLDDVLADLPSLRDKFISRLDVNNICNALQKINVRKHVDDAKSVQLWYEFEKENIFFYHPHVEGHQHFVLGIQTPWMLQNKITLSHNSIIAMDSTFNTNAYKYQLYTLLVFDKQESGLPIAWVICERNRAIDIEEWLQVLRERVIKEKPDWNVLAFLTDDALPEITAIRRVFNCPRHLLCVWHVRRAWLLNVNRLASSSEVAKKMFAKLGQIMHTIDQTIPVTKLMDDFFDEFKEEKSFLRYFEQTWLAGEKLRMWAKQFRDFPHKNQDTNNSIESYHSKLKLKFLGEKRTKSARRMDWLIFTLIKRVEPYYKNKQLHKSVGFENNHKKDKSLERSVDRSRTISDSHCSPHETIVNGYWVISQSKESTRYLVTIFGPEFCSCECMWALRGNICKHVLKIKSLIGCGWPVINATDVNTVTPLEQDFGSLDYYFRQIEIDLNVVPQDVHSETSPLPNNQVVHSPNWTQKFNECMEFLTKNPPQSPTTAQALMDIVAKIRDQAKEASSAHQFKLDQDPSLKRMRSCLSPVNKFKKKTLKPVQFNVDVDANHVDAGSLPFLKNRGRKP